MRKNGFTLAEVLITLTIIGVIAALTIPQFAAETHNQSNASKLSAIHTEYENAFGIMLLKEDVENIFETDFGESLSGSSETNFRDRLGKYMKVSRTGDELSDFGYLSYNSIPLFVPAAYADFIGETEEFKEEDGDLDGEGPITADEGAEIIDDFGDTDTDTDTDTDPDADPDTDTAPDADDNGVTGPIKTIDNHDYSMPAIKFGAANTNGAVVLFTAPVMNNTNNRMYSTMYIDVNGKNSPNRLGRDVFRFVLAQDGHLYPFGSRQAATESLSSPNNQTWDNSSANNDYRCSGSSGFNGQGCTARLVENNYKVDY